MTGRRAAATALAACSALALAGCSPLDGEPVPAEQTAGPWMCDGVSRVSVERIVGNPSVPMQSGDWRTLKDTGFECRVDSPHGAVDIIVTPFSEEEAGAASAEAVAQWQAADGEPIVDESGSPGQGYLTGEPGQVVTAGWVCTTRKLEVVLSDVWLDDRRDQRADARNLLVSVLPFACAMRQVPDVDYTDVPG